LTIAAVVCLRAGAESVSQLPQPTSYVEDLAGVIDAGSKQQMEQLSREVYEKAHATIEVVTIHSLDGETIEQFATELEEKWKVGPKGSDRGVLMILAINDHKRRIEVGYGLEGILNDAKVGDIGRSMVPALQQAQYGAALLNGEQQMAQVIAADANVTLSTPVQQPVPRRQAARRGGGSSWIGLVIFMIVFFFILRGGRGGGGGGGWLPWFLLGNLMGGGRGRWGGGGGFGGDGGGDGGGGGGDGGGDFGGGFGGDSGGGGASGDW
jgi:uncharacterized protein